MAEFAAVFSRAIVSFHRDPASRSPGGPRRPDRYCDSTIPGPRRNLRRELPLLPDYQAHIRKSAMEFLPEVLEAGRLRTTWPGVRSCDVLPRAPRRVPPSLA